MRKLLTIRLGVVAAGLVVLALAHAALVRDQQPTTYWDSSAYTEEARQPLAWAQLYYPKPILPSLLYRVVGTDPYQIAELHEWLSFAAWAAFGIALVASFRTRRARIVAGAIAVCLVLDPMRLGYCDDILSESIDDSLLALLVAALLGALALRGRARTAAWAAAAVVATCWLLARDTNAVVMLVALALVVGWRRRALLGRHLELAAIAGFAAVSVFVLWSTTVRPPPTGLTFQHDWPDDFTARITYSMMNNVVDRVLVDPDALQFFVAHGLPQADALAQLPERAPIIFDPKYGEARHWIATSAKGVWLSYLAHHPIDRLTDQVSHFWQLAGVADEQRSLYSPRRMRGAWRRVRALMSNHAVVLGLLVLAPLGAWLARRHRLVPPAIAMVIAGWLGSIAALYGDSAEVARHCYGSGQLVVLGLALVLLCALESVPFRAHHAGGAAPAGGDPPVAG